MPENSVQLKIEISYENLHELYCGAIAENLSLEDYILKCLDLPLTDSDSQSEKGGEEE